MPRPKSADPARQRTIRLPESMWADLDKESERTGLPLATVVKLRLGEPGAAARIALAAAAHDQGEDLVRKPLTLRLEEPHREALLKIRQTFGYRNNQDAVRMLILRVCEHIDAGQVTEPRLPPPQRIGGVAVPPQARMRSIAEVEAERNRRLSLAKLFAPKAKSKT